MSPVRLRWIGRRDRGFPLLRLFVVLWGLKAGDGGYRRRLSVGLRPAIWSRVVVGDEWIVTALGVRLHHKSHPRGVFV